jgi:hypothetical protein
MASTTAITQEKLLTEEELLEDEIFQNVSPYKFGRLRRDGFIPFLKLGHKTYRYQKTRVLDALVQLEGHPKKGDA